jgi:hypothetical protein
MSQRLTGNAAQKATRSAKASEPQKSGSPRPAAMAPGMMRTMSVSMISIVPMLRVSEASASGAVRRRESPERRSGRAVREYPKKKASAIESTTDGRLLQPRAVAITSPSTSPIAHPVRQCKVALRATRLGEASACRTP